MINLYDVVCDLPGSYFIYDLDSLHQHVSTLNAGNAKLFFACKANPLSVVLRTLKDVGLCFDVASKGELQQILSLQVPGSKIIMTGPAKSENLLRFALSHGVSTFVIESPYQLHLLQDLVQDYSYEPNVLLRLHLQWHGNEKSVLGGSQITPFGMDVETAQALLPQIKLPFLGFHVFQWGNILDANKLRYIWNYTVEVCKKLKSDFHVLDVGGGLGIPYQGEDSLKWEVINEIIYEIRSFYQIPEIWLEMGRYIVGPYGKYVTQIVDRKSTYGKDILVLEGGINHITRPALVGEPFPVELLRDSKEPLLNFSLHGPLCTAADFLGNHLLPADSKIGDFVIFKQVGAYGFTESMPFFLCHSLPGEAIIESGKFKIVREPQSAFDAWLR